MEILQASNLEKWQAKVEENYDGSNFDEVIECSFQLAQARDVTMSKKSFLNHRN